MKLIRVIDVGKCFYKLGQALRSLTSDKAKNGGSIFEPMVVDIDFSKYLVLVFHKYNRSYLYLVLNAQ